MWRRKQPVFGQELCQTVGSGMKPCPYTRRPLPFPHYYQHMHPHALTHTHPHTYIHHFTHITLPLLHTLTYPHTHTYPIIVLTRSPLQAHNVVGGDDKIVTCQTAQRKILVDIMATYALPSLALHKGECAAMWITCSKQKVQVMKHRVKPGN